MQAVRAREGLGTMPKAYLSPDKIGDAYRWIYYQLRRPKPAVILAEKRALADIEVTILRHGRTEA